jgi:hypothetical protein
MWGTGPGGGRHSMEDVGGVENGVWLALSSRVEVSRMEAGGGSAAWQRAAAAHVGPRACWRIAVCQREAAAWRVAARRAAAVAFGALGCTAVRSVRLHH